MRTVLFRPVLRALPDRDNQTFFEATAAAIPELDRLIEERTNGGITILQFWRVPENEIFFFSNEQTDDNWFSGPGQCQGLFSCLTDNQPGCSLREYIPGNN